ncbi:MAG TPA: M1 family aminopeptidase [Nitrospiraceae bacterium]|nr:M1 family aminopeptidase [Nitrospiraceae bacterium]
MIRLRYLIIGLLVSLGCSVFSFPSEPLAAVPSIRHHQLIVELIPSTHQLIVTDHLTVEAAPGTQSVEFSLASSLHVERIELDSCTPPCQPSEVKFETTVVPEHPGTQRLTLHVPFDGGQVARIGLMVRYAGEINDPPRDPRHLRFVTPSETAGYIGSEGVYLSSETQWYPDIEGSLATYDLSISVPDGWSVVSQGAMEQDGRRWAVSTSSEALTVVANRFVVKTRDWKSRSGQPIQLAAYLFPEEAALAEEYLDASARYLDAYIPLLGPYPFPKFAVVENFFSSGLGMPSFTLLGSGVIKRHYTQPYALGHEIVHSWIGNGVFNRIDRGNWVEGLTTYLSNYYYHELTGEEAQAREQRRLMILGYSVYVGPGSDYPVAAFTRKSDEKDNAIGYQKAAMVFHMLRREIGEAGFWQGVRTLVSRYQGQAADWQELETVFEETAGRELRWFFAQWVESDGAPGLSFEASKIPSLDKNRTDLNVRIDQGQSQRRFHLELEFLLSDGARHSVEVVVASPTQQFTITLPGRPLSMRVDPNFQLFRRIPRSDMPPMLNLYVTDRRRTLVMLSGRESGATEPLRGLIQRIQAQEQNKPENERTVVVEDQGGDPLPAGSILILGGFAERPPASALLRECGDRLHMTGKGFAVGGRAYDGSTKALLVSCHRQAMPGSVVTLLYGVTPEAASTVARLLFFYGWQSYVVFDEGKVVARGDWDDRMNAEVRLESN